MPIEYILLQGAPVSVNKCPACGAQPFEPFLRGMVQRGKKKYIFFGPKRDYCALICSSCKELVGYESPSNDAQR
jgi:hypothetical protein